MSFIRSVSPLRLAAGLAVCGLAVTSSGIGRPASASASSRATPLTVVANDPWSTTLSYNPFSPNFLGQVGDAVLLPLAAQDGATVSSLLPELAASWRVSNGDLEVVLQKGARWSNGNPVTSEDVVDSSLLHGVDSDGLWADISSVKHIGKSKVSFALVPKIAPSLVLQTVLEQTIVPAHQYGRFVTARLSKAVPAYYSAYRADPKQAQSSPLQKYMSGQLTHLETYAPSLKDFVTDGPYRLTGVNGFEATMAKSPTFFGKRKVHVARIVWEELNTSENLGAMVSGRADYSWTGFESSDYQKEVQHGYHLAISGAVSANGLVFNDRKYPLNLLAVRKAIAYVVRRRPIVALADGGTAVDKYTPYPVWIGNSLLPQYLTKSQLKGLNKYSYDPAKATQLLKSAGFKKGPTGWTMPNGKPFTLTVQTITGWTQPSGMVTAAAGYLSSFGIKSSVISVPYASYTASIDNGSFDLSFAGSDFYDPLQDIANVLGTDNFVSSSEPGIGFGPTETVPGLGKVQVAPTVAAEALSTGGKKLRSLTYDWAKLVDEQLPVLDLYGGVGVEQYSTAHYVDWPAGSKWTGADIFDMIEQGYIRPKK